MTNWNHDVASAPQDGSRFLMATTDGNIFFTRWLKPSKFTPNGRFDGFSENAKTLMAWHEVPKHPNEFAAIGQGLVDQTHTEINLPILEDCGSGA